MITVLKNEYIQVQTDSHGAAIQHLESRTTGTVFVRPVKEDKWTALSLVLFPTVSAIADGYMMVDGNSYPLTDSGFARNFEFKILAQTEDTVEYELEENEETLKLYPYHFRLIIRYKLTENTVGITARVVNTDSKKLYYALGFHPFFLCPLNEEPYSLYFKPAMSASRYIRENLLVTGKIPLFLDCVDKIGLKDGMFQDGAYALTDVTSRDIMLVGETSGKTVSFSAEEFQNITLWAPPSGPMKFINIECWNGSPDYGNTNHNWMEKPDLWILGPREEDIRHLTIAVNG